MVTLPESKIEKLIAERTEARKRGDYARADEIRAYLLKHGVVVEDMRDGSSDWRANF